MKKIRGKGKFVWARDWKAGPGRESTKKERESEKKKAREVGREWMKTETDREGGGGREERKGVKRQMRANRQQRHYFYVPECVKIFALKRAMYRQCLVVRIW